MLLPLQGANSFYTILPTQGVASLALGYVLHWAFSPSLLCLKLNSYTSMLHLLICTSVQHHWSSSVRSMMLAARQSAVCIIMTRG